ncbi:hypothetical protein MTO96_003299 [Rhipicephalus appendiculatus]
MAARVAKTEPRSRWCASIWCTCTKRKTAVALTKLQLTIPEETAENTSDCRDSDEEEDSKSSAKKDKQEEPSFSCANFSPCSTYFMAVTNSKRLIVWKRHSPGNWEAIFQRHVARKSIQSLGGKLVIGRLSMVLNMIIGEQDNFLAVSDRDEKIQVSCYPNCYNIRTFCLGHTQFVTCLALLPGPPELLVSGSGMYTMMRVINVIHKVTLPSCLPGRHDSELGAQKPVDSYTGTKSASRNRLGDTKENVESRKPAVKRLALQPSGTTMACLIDELPEVLLLGWQGPEAGWSRLQSLAVPCTPDDVAFDDDGQLWVTLTSPPSVQLFAHSTDSNGQWRRLEVPAELSSAGELPWAPLLKDISSTLCQSLQGNVIKVAAALCNFCAVAV